MPRLPRPDPSLLEALVLAVLLTVVGKLARRATGAAWQGVTREPPPKNPADPSVAMRDAMAWAVLSGVAVGLTRLAVRRGMASRRIRSALPD